jgi:glycosyltransferase involved in cell wall biosynthesis
MKPFSGGFKEGKSMPNHYSFYLPKGKKIKVMLVVENFDKGGLEQVVYDLAMGLKQGARIQPIILVVNRAGWFAHRARTVGIEVIELPRPFDQHAYWEIIQEFLPDLINSHGICFGAKLGAKHGIPFIQTIHNTYVWLSPSKINEYREMEKYTAAYVCVSRNVAKYSDLKLKLDPGLMRIVPNGIDIKRFNFSVAKIQFLREQLRGRFNLNREDFVFLCTSAFYRHKGQLEAIEALHYALRLYPRLKMLFVGANADPTYYEEVLQTVGRLMLRDRVIFAGFQEDPVGFYYAADAFIQPSYWEGWSLALAEALYAGLPVVVTDVGAARDLLADGGLGILVAPPFQDITQLDSSNWSLYLTGECGDRSNFVARLAEAMLRCAQAKWPESERMRSQQLIRDKYSVERMVSDYERLYFEVVTAPKICFVG